MRLQDLNRRLPVLLTTSLPRMAPYRKLLGRLRVLSPSFSLLFVSTPSITSILTVSRTTPQTDVIDPKVKYVEYC
ncbi:hypothetical protein PM082_023591 [Marasmius tenuissimus]|nr:hypothetical protein PM082_023591 [Marasmius tenuissimus]